MADDNEVKGTRGFIVTTEPDAKSKDFIAQYLKDKAVEQANLQAEREADVPDFRRTQRQTLDRADFRSDRADPDQTMGALGNKPSGLSEGVGNILERENRTTLYKECLKFLSTRVDLDLALFKDDIWSH